jgi:hypothetical protein
MYVYYCILTYIAILLSVRESQAVVPSTFWGGGGRRGVGYYLVVRYKSGCSDINDPILAAWRAKPPAAAQHRRNGQQEENSQKSRSEEACNHSLNNSGSVVGTALEDVMYSTPTL